MKFVLLFVMSVIVAVSNQQLNRAPRPRTLVWLTPYSLTRDSTVANIYPAYDERIQNEIPSKLSPHLFRRQQRPSIATAYWQNEDYFLTTDEDENHVEYDNDRDNEYPDVQSRIKWLNGFKDLKNKGFPSDSGRVFFSSTINNPFFKTATFTITSTVTTLGSVIICVPANNLADNPAPTCAGRKRREIDHAATGPDDSQFAVLPSEPLKMTPTALPSDLSLQRQSRVLLHTQKKTGPQRLASSKDEVISSLPQKPFEEDESHLREKRVFGGTGFAASTTLTSYSFIAATVTSTVLLDPTGMNVAVCLPSGYVVCA